MQVVVDAIQKAIHDPLTHDEFLDGQRMIRAALSVAHNPHLGADDVDQAIRLVERGCPPETAFRIVYVEQGEVSR